MKLGFVALLAGGGKGGFNIGRGARIPIGGDGDKGDVAGNVTEAVNEVTGGAVNWMKDTLGVWYYFILPIILVVVALSLVMTYVTSVFAFIFLEALDTRKVLIKKSWQKSKGLGFSFFLFRIVIGLIVLGTMALAALPMIIPMIQQGAVTYFENFSMWNFAWIIPAILVLLLFFFVMAIFMSLVYNFGVVHMYFKRIPTWASVKAVFRKINKTKLEVFVFLLAKLVINIVAGIGGVLLVILLLFPLLLLAVPFVLIFWGLVAALGWTAPVIAGIVVVGIAGMIFFIYVFAVIFLPVSTFARYFSIRNYKALMKK